MLAIAGGKAANFQSLPKKTRTSYGISNNALKPDFPTITTGPESPESLLAGSCKSRKSPLASRKSPLAGSYKSH